MRITRRPRSDYGVDTESLLVGRIYNLDPAFACALLLDGCAEVYDLLDPEERREHKDALVQDGWAPAAGTRPHWLRKP